MMTALAEVLARLPGKDCGLCGRRTCRELAEQALLRPEELNRCPFLHQPEAGRYRMADTPALTWKDALGRDYDFVLDPYEEDPGPRETIALFNPANVERLALKRGDVLIGRPSTAGCPVTHCGMVMAEPDAFNGIIEWCIVGPQAARERGINIGHYDIIAYEGMVRQSRVELVYGMRYHFLPRYCMLQARHSGVVNFMIRAGEVTRVRLEGIMLG